MIEYHEEETTSVIEYHEEEETTSVIEYDEEKTPFVIDYECDTKTQTNNENATKNLRRELDDAVSEIDRLQGELLNLRIKEAAEEYVTSKVSSRKPSVSSLNNSTTRRVSTSSFGSGVF
jgi:DNA repair exonuclease SbcCD nuclease subunit